MKAPNEKILKYNKGMKFDCIVSNAPYDRGLHEKFEAKYFELCKGEIVWNDPNSEFLEPSFGNGNFIVYIIYNKIKHGSTWEQALSHTWGVELIESNVKETHDRVIKLLHNMNIKFDESKAIEIMEHNLVCSNFFDWDFDNWCPIIK